MVFTEGLPVEAVYYDVRKRCSLNSKLSSPNLSLAPVCIATL